MDEPNNVENDAFTAAMIRLCAIGYFGSTCLGCGKPLNTMEEINNSVWWPHDNGDVGHKECYEKQVKIVKEGLNELCQ